MSIENLMMRFDNPSGVFYAGQMVTGSIQFVVTKPCQSDGVFVVFTGRADIEFTKSCSVKRKWTGGIRKTGTVTYGKFQDFFGYQDLFNQKNCVHNPPDGILVPNTYSFNFALQLPMHIPSSFIGSFGAIHYHVGLHFSTNVNNRDGHGLSKICILPFSVVGIKDINLTMPEEWCRVVLKKYKTFGVLPWKSKPLTATLEIDRQVFVSGENILVSGIINNESNVKIKECELKLIMHVEYRAEALVCAGPPRPLEWEEKRNESKTVYKCTLPGIEKASAASWSNVPVFVPCLPPSGLDGCYYISTRYTLLIRIVPPEVRFALEVDFPITIFTIPFLRRKPRFAVYPSNPIPGPAHQPGGADYEQGGAGYLPQPMPGQGGASHPPQPMPGAGGAGYLPLPLGKGYAPPPFPGNCGAGPIPEKELIPVNSAYSALVLPPYGDNTPTYGDYLGDSTESPSYDCLFKGADIYDHQFARDYMPKYPTFNIPS